MPRTVNVRDRRPIQWMFVPKPVQADDTDSEGTLSDDEFDEILSVYSSSDESEDSATVYSGWSAPPF